MARSPHFYASILLSCDYNDNEVRIIVGASWYVSYSTKATFFTCGGPLGKKNNKTKEKNLLRHVNLLVELNIIKLFQ